jgi:hypothetical protein
VHAAVPGKILILSPHVMTAALMGWYVELARLEPAFSLAGESPEDALARVRPVAVVLVDAEVESALSDLFVLRALKRQVGIAVFSGRPTRGRCPLPGADRHGVPFFRLPVDLERFGRMLDQALFKVPERRVRGRRAPGSTDRALDGTLVYSDDAGRAWYVYDRRAGDRRANGTYRAFVDADGNELRVPLEEDGFTRRTADALAAQLVVAEPVG